LKRPMQKVQQGFIIITVALLLCLFAIVTVFLLSYRDIYASERTQNLADSMAMSGASLLSGNIFACFLAQFQANQAYNESGTLTGATITYTFYQRLNPAVVVPTTPFFVCGLRANILEVRIQHDGQDKQAFAQFTGGGHARLVQ